MTVRGDESLTEPEIDRDHSKVHALNLKNLDKATQDGLLFVPIKPGSLKANGAGFQFVATVPAAMVVSFYTPPLHRLGS